MNSRKLTARTNSLQPVHWFPFLLCALCVLCGLCVNSFFSCAYVAHFIRKYYKFHSKLVLYRNIIGQSNFFMLACLVDFRSQLRHASQLGGLFPFSPYITSLLPYFLFPSLRDETPSRQPLNVLYLHPIAISPLAATFMGLPASVANKRLAVLLSHLDATLTKNKGVGVSVMVNQESNKNHYPERPPKARIDLPPTMSGSRITSYLSVCCRLPARMLRFGVP